MSSAEPDPEQNLKVPETPSQTSSSAAASLGQLNRKSSTSSLDEAVAKLRLGLPKGMSSGTLQDTQVDMDVDEPGHPNLQPETLKAQATPQVKLAKDDDVVMPDAATAPAATVPKAEDEGPEAPTTVPDNSMQSKGENQGLGAPSTVPDNSMQSKGLENQGTGAPSTVPDNSMQSKGLENQGTGAPSTVPDNSMQSKGENQDDAGAPSTVPKNGMQSKGENQGNAGAPSTVPQNSMQSEGLEKNQGPAGAPSTVPDTSMQSKGLAENQGTGAPSTVPDISMQSEGPDEKNQSAQGAPSTVPDVSMQSEGPDEKNQQGAPSTVPGNSMQSKGLDEKQLQVHEVLRRPNTCDLSAGMVPGHDYPAGSELMVSVFMDVGGTKTRIQIRGMTAEQALAKGFELVGDSGDVTSSSSKGPGPTEAPAEAPAPTAEQDSKWFKCRSYLYIYSIVVPRAL